MLFPFTYFYLITNDNVPKPFSDFIIFLLISFLSGDLATIFCLSFYQEKTDVALWASLAFGSLQVFALSGIYTLLKT